MIFSTDAQEMDVPVITSANASELQAIQINGYGLIRTTAWSARNQIAIATTAGLYLFDGENLDSDSLKFNEASGAGKSTSLAFSQDGNLLVSGSESAFVQIFDVDTGEMIAVIEGHEAPITDVEVSLAHNVIFTGDTLGNVLVWDLQTFEQLQAIAEPNRIHSNSDIILALSPDETTLAYYSSSQLTLWDIDEQEIIFTHSSESRRDAYIDFSPDSNLIAIALEGEVVVLNISTQEAISTINNGFYAKELVFSEDNQTIFISGEETLNQWDIANNELMNTFLVGYLGSITLNPTGTTLMVSDRVPTIEFWDITDPTTTEPFDTIDGFDYVPSSFAFSSDGRLMASVSLTPFLATDTARLVDIASGTTLTRFPKLEAFEGVIGFSPNNQYLVITGGSFRTRIFDTMTYEEILRLEESFVTIVFSPDSTRIAVSENNAFDGLTIYDIESGNVIHQFDERDSTYFSMAFSDDGQTLNIVMRDGTILSADAETGEILSEIDFIPANNQVIEYSVSSQMLITSENNHFNFWDRNSGEQVSQIRNVAEIYEFALSPNGQVLAISEFSSTTIQLWDTITGEQIDELEGHVNDIFVLTFNHDGTALISSSLDGTWRLWQIPN